MNIAEWNECVSSQDYKNIEDAYNNLQNEDINSLNWTLPQYIKDAYMYENIVKNEDC